ncbi:MAG: hypothetical protein RL846_01955 [Deltaproteobacteria bacterium]
MRAIEVALSEPETCRVIEATVESVQGRLRLSSDSEARVVSTVAVAAAVLESWAETELTDALVEGPAPGAPRVEAPRPVVPSAPVRAVARPEATEAPTSFGGAVRAEAGLDERAVLMTGVYGRVDLALGDFVGFVGGRFFVAPADVSGDASDGRRASAAAQVGVERPWAALGGTLAPGVAAGLRWSRTSRVEPDVSQCSFERCVLDEPLVRDDFVFSSVRPTVEVHVRASWALSASTQLEAALSGAYVLLAEDAPTPSYAATTTALALPSESAWLARLGVGLRWGR